MIFQLIFFLNFVIGQEILNCLDQQNDKCVQCLDNYIFSEQDDSCIYKFDCQMGYFKDEQGVCIPCESTCKECYGASDTQCKSCFNGYFIKFINNGETQCINCSTSDCKECQNNVCTQCNNEFMLIDGECKKCQSQSNCQTCNESLDKCLTCPLGYNLISDKCIQSGQCQQRQFVNQFGECLTCDNSCINCQDFFTCYKCEDGFFLQGQKELIQNQDQQRIFCQRCSDECLTCETDQNSCTSCKGDLKLRGNRCVEQCEDDEYFDQIEQKCKNCHQNCATCMNYDICTSCLNGLLLINNQCTEICKENQFKDLETQQCLTCDQNCKTCIDQDDNCLSCEDGFLLSENQCVTSCFPGYFINGFNCQKCGYPCKSCQALSLCSECEEPYKLINGQCELDDNQSNSECEENKFILGQHCLENCPMGTVKSTDQKCNCVDDCLNCRFSLTSGKVQCLQCENQQFYDYNGFCLKFCPKKTFIFETNELKQCLQVCPQGFFQVEENNTRICKSKCPQFTVPFKNTCLKQNCPESYFFDQEFVKNNPISQINEVLIDQDLINLGVCQQCHSSCKSCSGSSINDCLSCQDSFLQILQEEKFQAICVQHCLDGFIKQENKCVPCISDCEICIESLFYFEKQCHTQCPQGSIQQENSNICLDQYQNLEFFINIQTTKIFGYYSFNEDLEINLKIEYMKMDAVQELQKLECKLLNIIDENEQLLNLNFFNKQFTQFDLKIEKKLLMPNQTYELSCQAYVNEFCNKNQSVYINTISEPQGNFEITPNTGISYLTKYNMKIDNWKINELINLPLSYKFYLKYLNKNDEQQIIFLDQNDDMIFYQKEEMEKINLNFTNQKIELNDENKFAFIRQPNIYNKQFRLPYVFKEQIIQVILEISLLDSFFIENNLKFFKLKFQKSLDLNTLPGNQTIINNLFNDIQSDDQVDLTQVNILANSIAALIDQNQTNFVKMIANQNALNNQNLNSNSLAFFIQTLKKENYNDYLYPCDSLIDCNNNGKCRQSINHFYQKCICDQDFDGHQCQWDIQQLYQAKKFIKKSIQIVKNEQNIESQVDLLNSMSKIYDAFDIQDIQELVSIVKNIKQVNSIQYYNKTMQVLNNIYELIKIHKPFDNSQTELNQIVKDIFPSVSSLMENNLLPIYFENIKGSIQHLDQFCDLQTDATFKFQYQINNNEINNVLIVFPNKISKILQYQLLPQKFYNKKYFSEVLSLDFYDKKLNSKFKIDSEEKIKIYIPKILKIKKESQIMKDELFKCMSKQNDDSKWDEINLKDEFLDQILCETQHFSDFAIFIQDKQEVLRDYINNYEKLMQELKEQQIGNFLISLMIFGIISLIYLIISFIIIRNKKKLVKQPIQIKFRPWRYHPFISFFSKDSLNNPKEQRLYLIIDLISQIMISSCLVYIFNEHFNGKEFFIQHYIYCIYQVLILASFYNYLQIYIINIVQTQMKKYKKNSQIQNTNISTLNDIGNTTDKDINQDIRKQQYISSFINVLKFNIKNCILFTVLLLSIKETPIQFWYLILWSFIIDIFVIDVFSILASYKIMKLRDILRTRGFYFD